MSAEAKMTSDVKLAGDPRPRFFADPGQDMLWEVVVALSSELGATRARLDAVERLLANQGSLPAGSVDTYVPDQVAATARVHDAQAYVQRVFRPLAED